MEQQLIELLSRAVRPLIVDNVNDDWVSGEASPQGDAGDCTHYHWAEDRDGTVVVRFTASSESVPEVIGVATDSAGAIEICNAHHAHRVIVQMAQLIDMQALAGALAQFGKDL